MKDRRGVFKKGLNGLYLPFYEALCEELGPEWGPYSGYRSFYSQDALYAKGRTAPGEIVTEAKGGESSHNWGCGTDWTKWQDEKTPIWLTKEDPDWQEYIEAVTRIGLRSGAEFGDVDHNELKIEIPWSQILAESKRAGVNGVNLLLKISMTDQTLDSKSPLH